MNFYINSSAEIFSTEMSNFFRHSFIDTMCKSHTRQQFMYFNKKLVILLKIKISNYFEILEMKILTRIVNKDLKITF